MIYTLSRDERAVLITDWCMATWSSTEYSMVDWFIAHRSQTGCRLFGDAALDLDTDHMQIEAPSDSALVEFKLLFLCE